MYETAHHASNTALLVFLAGSLAFVTIGALIPFRTPFRRTTALLAVLLATALGFWLTRPPTPAVATVNGVYRNGCCEPITLQNGVLVTSTLSAPFKLRLMKYGLDTEMQRGIEVQNGKIVLSKTRETGGFLFSDDLRAFTLCARTCGDGREFEFRRS